MTDKIVVRVFWHSLNSSKMSLNYEDFVATNWEATSNLLIITQEDYHRYIPLTNVSNFIELTSKEVL